MDDDATTIAKVHNEIDNDIQKLSDKNHNLKNFTNSFYCLQKEQKLQKVLSTKTITILESDILMQLRQTETVQTL